MKFLFRNRVVSAISLAGLLIVVLVAGRSLFHSPAKVGDFVVPVLPNWKQEFFSTTWSDRAACHKKMGNNRLNISLMWNKIKPARTLQQMQQVIQNGGHATMPTSRPGMQVQPVLEQSTVLNGMPAILTQTNYQTSSVSASTKSLHFFNKGKHYFLTAGLSTPSTSPASPAAQAELDQVWKTITQQLVP